MHFLKNPLFLHALEIGFNFAEYYLKQQKGEIFTVQEFLIMPLNIKAKKVRSKSIRPASSNRTNSVLANSSNSFLTPGSVAIVGVLLFLAFVFAQIIFII